LEILLLVAVASATALATGLGAIPVFMLGTRAEELRPPLLGFAAGAMGLASVVGLFLPALDEGSTAQAVLGLAAGVAFLVVSRALLHHGERPGAPRLDDDRRLAALVFLVLLVHSLPEGFAIGTAYASDTAGLGVFVILAIAFQNIPEGTSVAIPMAAAGESAARQFWVAVGTSAPQPVGAVIAYLLVEQVESLLPLSFAFAAGAMLSLVVIELLPPAFAPGARLRGAAGLAVGLALMTLLSALFGV
jgi:ZIP family zinc transporter